MDEMKVIRCSKCRGHLATTSKIRTLCPFCSINIQMRGRRIYFKSYNSQEIAAAVQHLNSEGHTWK